MSRSVAETESPCPGIPFRRFLQGHGRGRDDRATASTRRAGRRRPPRSARRARCRRRRGTGSAGCCASSPGSGRRARAMPARSPLTSVTPALWIATSVPVPMATPTSASASAGASFTPSPAIATTRPCAFSAPDDLVLVLGQDLGLDIVDAQPAGHRLGGGPVVAGQHDDADAVGPQRLQRLRRARLDRIGDRDDPAGPAVDRQRTAPWRPRAGVRPRAPPGRRGRRPGPRISLALPRDTMRPPTLPTTPLPVTEAKSRDVLHRPGPAPWRRRRWPRPAGARSTAPGWPPATGRSPRRSPAPGPRRPPRGLPSVSVPVLSTTSVSTFSNRSSASAFLISTPAVAPLPTPTMIDMGVARPSAQGQAMIRTDTAAISP